MRERKGWYLLLALWWAYVGLAEESGRGLEQPSWVGCVEGISDDVLSPWTPLLIQQSRGTIRIDCWERSYLFGEGFPRQVWARGEALLAEPCDLAVKVEGQVISWRRKEAVIVHKGPNRGEFRFRMEGSGLELISRVFVEYDGMVRVDFSLVPDNPLLLDSVTFLVPMKSERARYWYHYPGQWGSHSNTGFLPKKGYTGPFRPLVWLGDESRGLAWFCESERGWHPLDREDCTRVFRQEETTVLALNLVTEPWLLGETLSFTFGFHATPARDSRDDLWEHRICHEGAYDMEERMLQGVGNGDLPILDWLRDSGVRTICFHEDWTPVQNHFEPSDSEGLRNLVSACHARGMRLLLQFGYQMSDADSEWEEYSERCLVYPMRGEYERTPQQMAYMVCYNSPWQDRLAWSVARVMDEYDVDGVYLDGTAHPWACGNTLHGCGFERPDGGRGFTYPIFATREMMRRIYTIVKSRKKDGLVHVNQATCMTIPTLSWSTGILDGEQFSGLESQDGLQKLYPLDVFRAQFMGHPWGLSSEMYCNDEMFLNEHAFAISLLHDSLVMGRPAPSLETLSRLWAMSDGFGRKQARWIPYWESERIVSVFPDQVKVSAYQREKSLLLVLSNLSGELQEATIFLDEALWMPGKEVRTRDALSWERVDWAWDSMNVRLDPMGWKIFLLEWK